MVNLIPEPDDAEKPGLRYAALAGGAVIAVFFGALTTWAALAPLESAAIAPGVVTVDTRRKTIQHLEGGIVSEILVREGDVVEAGQVLIRLEDVQASARLVQVRDAYHARLGIAARLAAERDRLETIDFPAQLSKLSTEPKVQEIIAGQLRVFEAKKQVRDDQVAIIEQQIAQSEQQIAGLEAEIAAYERQFSLLSEELSDLRALLAKDLVPKRRVLALEREQAQIVGNRGRNLATISQVRKSIAEAEIRIAELETTRVNEAVAEVQNIENRLRELTEDLRAASDVQQRTEIRAPIAGAVVGLQVHTVGGVIAPGAALMDIVPSEERLLIDARIRPDDIDAVSPGLLAQVQLTAFSQRNVRPLEGRLISVSADTLTEEHTGERYYLGRIELESESINSAREIDLHAGMQAQIHILTGTSSLLNYILNPILVVLDHSLKE